MATLQHMRARQHAIPARDLLPATPREPSARQLDRLTPFILVMGVAVKVSNQNPAARTPFDWFATGVSEP
jgi:hypothetical protein